LRFWPQVGFGAQPVMPPSLGTLMQYFIS